MEFDDNSMAFFQYQDHMREIYFRRRQQMILVSIMLLFVFPMFLVAILLVPPIRGILNQQEQIMSARYEGMKKIPDLEQKLEKLEGQIGLLTTESIDRRLQTIEKAINVGGLNTEDVATVIDIKKDMDTLKSYMFSDPKELVELKELQKNYKNLVESQSLYATQDSLESKIGFLRTILYVSLAFLGIILTAISLFVAKKPIQFEKPTRPVHKPPDSIETPEDKEVA